jgi:hypothetical protein
LFALALSAGLLTGESRRNETEPKLRIRIYDYADSEPNLLRRARRQATEVLEKAGVHPTWEQCGTSEAEANKNRSCTHTIGPHLIQLRVHPREMAKKVSKRSIEFGYALPSTEGFGAIAGVYLDRTAEIATSLGLDVYLLLGHTMAHEIGHLLLGSNSHARRGIMKPTWGEREIQLAKTGVLLFTDVQAEQMQRQIAERLQQCHPTAQNPGNTDSITNRSILSR